MNDREPTYHHGTLTEEWTINVQPDMVTVGPCIILVEAGNRESERVARMLAEHVRCVHARAVHEFKQLQAYLEAMRPLPHADGCLCERCKQ